MPVIALRLVKFIFKLVVVIAMVRQLDGTVLPPSGLRVAGLGWAGGRGLLILLELGVRRGGYSLRVVWLGSGYGT
jgi:hypothetical protein